MLLHAKLATEKAKWTDPHVKAYALLQAHFSRTSLSADLAADQRVVLRKATRLLQVHSLHLLWWRQSCPPCSPGARLVATPSLRQGAVLYGYVCCQSTGNLAQRGVVDLQQSCTPASSAQQLAAATGTLAAAVPAILVTPAPIAQAIVDVVTCQPWLAPALAAMDSPS